MTATFAADGASDTAGNTGPASATAGPSVLIDRSAPTVTIDLQASSDTGTSDTDNVTKATDLVFNVDFNEAISVLALGDFTVLGTAGASCSVSAPIGSGASYDVTLTGCGEGTVTLRLDAGGVTDTAGNANAQPAAQRSRSTAARRTLHPRPRRRERHGTSSSATTSPRTTLRRSSVPLRPARP